MNPEIENNRVVYREEGKKYHYSLSFYESGIVRYQLLGESRGQPSITFIEEKNVNPATDMNVRKEGEDVWVVQTGELICELRLSPWNITIRSKDGRTFLREFPEDQNVRGEWESLPTGVYSSSKGIYSKVNLELDPSAGYYGLGEKFSGLNHRGRRITCWNVNPYGSGTEKAYKNIPFLLTNRGYGLFLNSPARQIWDIGASSLFSLSIEVERPELDLWILPGKSLKGILGLYTRLTGRAPLPPRWSFGLWVSPYGDYLAAGGTWKQSDFISYAKTLRDRGISADVIHLDPFWMGKKKGLCDFQWDPEEFPDPKGFVRELTEAGFKICLWEHPYIEKDTPLYQEGKEKGYFLKNSRGEVYDCNLVIIPAERRDASNYRESFYAPGGIVDFTNPEAVEWYKQLHRPLIEMGVRTFKTDFGEVIPEDAVFFNGRTGKEMRNLYPLLYNKTVFEVLQEFDPRPVLWGRSGYAGIQKYPVQWSGDPHSNFRSLGTTLHGGLSYGLSGVPFWSFDMGGFKGKPSLEAYIRWMQVGLLISHARIHGTDHRMPWAYGERAYQIIREYVSLRYALLPYLYGLAYEATQTGLPVIRPLALENEEDPQSILYDTEFLLGSHVLVIPVLNEEGLVNAYFPTGIWYDLHTGSQVKGPAIVKERVDLERLPLFVSQGSMIPMAEPTPTVPDFWDPLI
ncbi:MAG: TIM-barrel domain-containing protein, partial [Spirochaetales bacterium]